MSLLALAVIVILCLAAGYLLYGSFIARQYRLDDAAVTPAVAREDGLDFVPTRPFYLLGQHFSAIAAAGPIVGPIAACMVFGWLPCVLWIVLGVIFIGAVHDFSALVASVRHGAGSIAEIARRNLGPRAWAALVAFIWLALVYVIVSFTDVTASTFIGKAEEFEGLPGVQFNPGGAVAAASTMYLLLAVLMGVVQKVVPERLRPMWLMTLLFVPATLGVVWLGTQISTWLVLPLDQWQWIILAYCFVASLLPVWVLQQPRGYLGGFVLYLAIGVGLVGVLFGGFEIKQPALSEAARAGGSGLWAFVSGSQGAPAMTGLLFPFLFVTIACGACSGFHGLVCGGTTSKQVAKESHCKSIGFGAMLLEGLVAIIALATIMIVEPTSSPQAPPVIYGDGLAKFMMVFLGPEAHLFAKTFGTMAVATFVFDTLDVATRLGRYLLQELFGRVSRLAGATLSLATVGLPLVILRGAPTGSWREFWTLFGTSNQLLASLTLMGVTVWLARTGRRYWYTLIPTVIVFTITVVAVGLQVLAGVRAALGKGWEEGRVEMLNGGVALALMGLAALFTVEAIRAAKSGKTAPA